MNPSARTGEKVHAALVPIDTDTASDDAVALIMALRSPEIHVAALTTVAGNITVEQATHNALYTAELCGADVSVYVGADRPLLRPHHGAGSVHGLDGLSDRGYPAPMRKPEVSHAVDVIRETVKANPGIELVTLGPLTNITLALAREPRPSTTFGPIPRPRASSCMANFRWNSSDGNSVLDRPLSRPARSSGSPVSIPRWRLRGRVQ
ncbi:MAG: nucleoside hydrolase [Acidobacteriota bacterium]|nr:nucleoside hydrolase [Acidobacteriota bacterium]